MNKSPDAFRTISEVAEQLDVPAHVLRFWETRFSQVKPVKRGGGRRYYRPDDVRLLRGIRGLLYDDGMTIKGVQKILREQGVRHVIGLGTVDEAVAPAAVRAAASAARPAAAVAASARLGNGADRVAADAMAQTDDAGREDDVAPDEDQSGADIAGEKRMAVPDGEIVADTETAPDGEAVPVGDGAVEQMETAGPEAAEAATEDDDGAAEDEDGDVAPARPTDRAALSRLVEELEALRRVMTEKPLS